MRDRFSWSSRGARILRQARDEIANETARLRGAGEAEIGDPRIGKWIACGARQLRERALHRGLDLRAFVCGELRHDPRVDVPRELGVRRLVDVDTRHRATDIETVRMLRLPAGDDRAERLPD